MGVTRRGSERGEGGLKPPSPTERNPEQFTSNYMAWSDPRLGNVPGGRSGLDARLSSIRGEQAHSALPEHAAHFQRAAVDPENSAEYRKTSAKAGQLAEHLHESGEAVNAPTRINDIASRYHAMLNAGIERRAADEESGLPMAKRVATPSVTRTGKPTVKRTIEEDQPTTAEQSRLQRRQQAEVPGAGWYFDHRRFQASHVEEGTLSPRQVTAMGGKLSALKTPEDEAKAIGGISRLVGSESSGMVNGQRVSDMPTSDLARAATSASAWNTYETEGRRERPDTPRPETGTRETHRALVQSGIGHTDMVEAAMQVARSEITPQEAFTLKGFTPKTSAYSEMQASSNPGSDVETDYRNTAAHLHDVVRGRQIPEQGMMQFSMKSEDQPLPHALGSDTPTAIDTWMGAAGSGQPIAAKLPTTGRTYSPAKRMVDKDMPLDMNAPSKSEMGIPSGDPSVTPGAVISAQHNEAIRRVSENRIGAVSHNQFGQAIFTPSSLIQEGVWVETRKQAGADSDYSARQQLQGQQAKQAVRDEKVAKKAQGTQRSLF